ncbi:hypothetical protein HKX48_008304 [Thoreauomyces humboldtii]|nr:hypothetical protein HKX48_008304 [Thoreauomyces humboldtii]
MLEMRPPVNVVQALLSVLFGLSNFEDAMNEFMDRNGMPCLLRLVQLSLPDGVRTTLLRIIRRLATKTAKGVPGKMRSRLVAALEGLKAQGDAAGLPGTEEARSARMELERCLETLRIEPDEAGSRSKSSEVRVLAQKQPEKALPPEDDYNTPYERPPTLIDFDIGPNISEDAIGRLVVLLRAPEFHIRAEAVGILREVTTLRKFQPMTVELLTRTLMGMLDDEDHIAVQAAGVLANLATFSNHRPPMAGCGLLPRLINTLSSYNVTLLEQVLRALRTFASEAEYAPDLSTPRSLRLLRVTVHAATTYGESARHSYQKLLDFGDQNLQLDSHHIINQDPWEQVVTEWRSDDFVWNKEGLMQRKKKLGVRRKKVKKAS